MKTLYVRIQDPAGNLMGEAEDKTFEFESGEIGYTAKQEIEYGGEAFSGVCYYTLAEQEIVQNGFYTIDFCCEGNLIGSFPFQIKK